MLVLVHFVSQQSSTPALSKGKGIAQRAFRRVKEGTSAVLLHTGSDELWWVDARAFSCYSRNVQDLLADGKTPYYRRFGELFDGPNVPFGANSEYPLITLKDKASKQVHPDFFGCAFCAGTAGEKYSQLRRRNYEETLPQNCTALRIISVAVWPFGCTVPRTGYKPSSSWLLTTVPRILPQERRVCASRPHLQNTNLRQVNVWERTKQFWFHCC